MCKRRPLFCSCPSGKFNRSRKNPLTTRRGWKIQRNKHSKITVRPSRKWLFLQNPKNSSTDHPTLAWHCLRPLSHVQRERNSSLLFTESLGFQHSGEREAFWDWANNVWEGRRWWITVLSLCHWILERGNKYNRAKSQCSAWTANTLNYLQFE